MSNWRKLYWLLKKDAIIARRHRKSAILMVLLPAVLFLAPAWLIDENQLLTYNAQQLLAKHGKTMSGSTLPIFATKPLVLDATHCKKSSNVTIGAFTSNHSNFLKKAKRAEQKCAPIGGVFAMGDGVRAVLPAAHHQVDRLKRARSSNPLQYSPTIYNHVALRMYQMGLFNFRRKFPLQGKEDLDSIQTFFVFEKEGNIVSMFPKIGVLIGGCMVFVVMAVARVMVAEKQVIQPYLQAIGLPTTLFHSSHFLFALSKALLAMIPATICHCIWYSRFHAFWLHIIILLFTTNAITFGMALATIIRKPNQVTTFVCVSWIGMMVVAYYWPVAKGWWQVVGVVNPHWVLQWMMLAVEPWFCQDSGMKFLDAFSSGRPDQYPCIIYLLELLLSTILFAFLSICKLSMCSKRAGRAGRASEDNEESLILCQENSELRKSATADIMLENVVKVYSNGQRALRGVNMRAIRGQVSVLLGHNGSGKSTTFGMITGMIKPSEGRVLIEGDEQSSNGSKVGYCPQSNPIYEELSVLEHLELITVLKSGSLEQFEEHAIPMLQQINLIEKLNTPAKNLSGGQKRKLCVCMAMLQSQVVLLDEPTAGMDPGARRDVQELIRKVKGEKTVLLTTHYMDEAEQLADWIFVLSNGRLVAEGGVAFLRKRFGDGVVLTIVLEQDMEQLKVLELCRSKVKYATIKDQRGQMIEIQIPEKKELPELLALLEQIMESKEHSLKITALGLASSSMEQVFINILKEADPKKQDSSLEQRAFQSLLEAKNLEPSANPLQILLIVLYKRLLFLSTNKLQMILQFFVPILLVAFLLLHEPLIKSDPLDLEHREFKMSNFTPSRVAVQVELEQDKKKGLSIMSYLKKVESLEVFGAPFNATLLELAKAEQKLKKSNKKKKRLGLIIRYSANHTTILYKESSPSNSLIALNLLINLKPLRVNENIGNETMALDILTVEGRQDTQTTFLTATFFFSLVFFALMLNIGSASTFLIDERVSKFLHQQMLTGISTTVFWMSSVFFDFLMFLVLAFFYLAMFAIAGVYRDYLMLVLLTFLLFFLAFTSLIYLLSLYSKSADSALSTYVALISTALLVLTIVFIMALTPMGQIKRKLWKMYGFGVLLPGYVPSVALTKIMFAEKMHSKRMGMAKNVFFDFDSIWEPFGIWIDMFYLILMTAVFTGIFISLKSSKFRKLLAGGGRAYPTLRRRKTFPITNRPGTPILEVTNLVKDYETMRAVNGLNFNVHQQECFGFLGQNGAGKTTTFDMLTGLTVPSGGTACIEGVEISQRLQIGYCPQFDAVMSQYKVSQCLLIIATLHRYKNPSEVVPLILNCVGLSDHAHKTLKSLSGGQKRKVSIGIALLSRAKCTMLDEPTAGIDARARREIWDVLHLARSQGAMVLTSHSMEECEALCSHVGVLQNGELIAMGSGQELKSRFGGFYVLFLELKELEELQELQNLQEEIKKEILRTWNDVKWKPTIGATIWCQIAAIEKWSVVWGRVKVLADKFQLVDFMVTQATLEDVFLKLIDY